MQAIEFSTILNQQNQIEIPMDYIPFFAKKPKMRIIILIDDADNEDDIWKDATAAHFLNGYSESDNIYDKI